MSALQMTKKIESEFIIFCSVFLWFGFISLVDDRQPLSIEVLGNLKAVSILGMVKWNNEVHIGNRQICQFNMDWHSFR